VRISHQVIDAVSIRNVEGIRPAAEALRDAVAELTDLKVAATHNIAVREPMKDAAGGVLASEVFGFGEEGGSWWRAPQLALRSPLPMACRFEAEPFWCNAAGFHTLTPNLLLAGFDLSNFEERALVRAAIVVPVHLPFGQIGAVSFLHRDAQIDDLSGPFDAHAHALALLGRTFITSYVKVTERRHPEVASVVLTKREVECLRWAAAGKTNDEIGLILGLQRTTVRFHIRSASAKLGAVNRDQTLFKAAQLGFLAMLR
jgi:DNA-binding CsgD family transcriptional regulator